MAQNLDTESSVINPFEMTDDKIKKIIVEIRGRPDESFDVDSLFIIVENILKRSTQIVDQVMQPDGKVIPSARSDGKNPKSDFNVPMCLLKQIGFELSCCKDPAADVSHKTTLRILEKLSDYTWEAKGVLTLAAFAMEFGDFWLLVELGQSNNRDQLTDSLAILKRTPSLTKTPELRQKIKNEVIVLNNLIKKTMEVMKVIFELDNLSFYDARSTTPIESEVYWVVMTVIACAMKVAILTSDDEDRPLNLNPYIKKVDDILRVLQPNLDSFRTKKEEEDRYSKFLKLWRNEFKTIDFLKGLFSANYDDVELIDCSDNSYNTTVKISELRQKTLLLVISWTSITDADINILNLIQNQKIKQDSNTQSQYSIVWVPIMDETKWPDFVDLVKTKKIQWYTPKSLVFHNFAVRFVKEEWHFKVEPVVVVLNVAQGKAENLNALHTIRIWGPEAFPYDEESERNLIDQMNWFYNIFNEVTDDTKIPSWITRGDYVFLQGGKDRTWVKGMEKKVKAIAEDPINKAANNTIKWADVEEKTRISERFWSCVQGLFLTKIHKQPDDNSPSKRQIQKLLSYKNDEGWFALNKGKTTLVVGHKQTFSRVVEDFPKWKEDIKDKSFEVAFKDYHKKIVELIGSQTGCSRLELPTTSGRVLEEIKCVECEKVMELLAAYNCCHKFIPMVN